MEYNIYCDESCHLEKDKSPIMLLGALKCPKQYVHKISNDLRQMKIDHNLSPNYELKWTKVSKGKINYFKDLIDYFFDNPSLSFRSVVASRTNLNHKKFRQTHDDWYYKIYFSLLSKMFRTNNDYYIYIDIKDTRSFLKTQKLQECLSKESYLYRENILRLQIVQSNEVELIQLTDFILGIVEYQNQQIFTSSAKCEICQYLLTNHISDISRTTNFYNDKFNLFFWNGRASN